MKSSAISELIGLVEQAETDAASYWTRKNLNYNQRFCLWAGQDETCLLYTSPSPRDES
jgi:hypothetical protein